MKLNQLVKFQLKMDVDFSFNLKIKSCVFFLLRSSHHHLLRLIDKRKRHEMNKFPKVGYIKSTDDSTNDEHDSPIGYTPQLRRRGNIKFVKGSGLTHNNVNDNTLNEDDEGKNVKDFYFDLINSNESGRKSSPIPKSDPIVKSGNRTKHRKRMAYDSTPWFIKKASKSSNNNNHSLKGKGRSISEILENDESMVKPAGINRFKPPPYFYLNPFNSKGYNILKKYNWIDDHSLTNKPNTLVNPVKVRFKDDKLGIGFNSLMKQTKRVNNNDNKLSARVARKYYKIDKLKRRSIMNELK